MKPIRVAIVGCGRISDLHQLGYRGREDAKDRRRVRYQQGPRQKEGQGMGRGESLQRLTSRCWKTKKWMWWNCSPRTTCTAR